MVQKAYCTATMDAGCYFGECDAFNILSPVALYTCNCLLFIKHPTYFSEARVDSTSYQTEQQHIRHTKNSLLQTVLHYKAVPRAQMLQQVLLLFWNRFADGGTDIGSTFLFSGMCSSASRNLSVRGSTLDVSI